MRTYLVLLVLSDILLSTMSGAFRISSTEDVTQRTMGTSVFPVTPSVTTVLGMKYSRSTSSTTSGKTDSPMRPSSISGNPNKINVSKDAIGIKRPQITTKPTSLSQLHDRPVAETTHMSGKANERDSTSSTTSRAFVGAKSSKMIHGEKSFTATTATVNMPPTFKSISSQQKIPARELLNTLAVNQRKPSSVTKQADALSSNVQSSAQNPDNGPILGGKNILKTSGNILSIFEDKQQIKSSTPSDQMIVSLPNVKDNHSAATLTRLTGQTTERMIKTTSSSPDLKNVRTSTPNMNGLLKGSAKHGSVPYQSENEPKRTMAQVSDNFSHNKIFDSLSMPKNSLQSTTAKSVSLRCASQIERSARNVNSLDLAHQSEHINNRNNHLATVAENSKPPTNTEEANNLKHLPTMQSLKTTNSQQIYPSIFPPKERYSNSNYKSLVEPVTDFGNDKQRTIPSTENTISTNKMTVDPVAMGTKTDHISKPASPRLPITTPYTTSTSQNYYSTKSPSRVITEGKQPREATPKSRIIFGAEKTENRMKLSNTHFPNILMLLGTATAPSKGNSGSFYPENQNTTLYGHTRTPGSKTSTPFLSEENVQEVQSINNASSLFNSSLLKKERQNEPEPILNSEQVEKWQRNFMDVLRSMFELHKGNSNVIIVPISIINNSGNVYLMDKNQGNQFSAGETFNVSKSQSVTKSLTGSEKAKVGMKYSSFSSTHFSTTPNYISEKSSKARESEVFESDEKPIIQKKKSEVYEEHYDVDADDMEFEIKRAPDTHNNEQRSKRKQSFPKAAPTGTGHTEGSIKETTTKPVTLRLVENNSVRNSRSSFHSHVRDEGYDSEDSTEPHTQANTIIVRKAATKTVAQRTKAAPTGNRRVRAGETDYDYEAAEYPEASLKNTEYLTRALGETKTYKHNSQILKPNRKYPSLNEEESSRYSQKRIPMTKERRPDYEDYAASHRKRYGNSYENYGEGIL